MYNSIEWKVKARQIKMRDKVCQRCGTGKLHVHHMIYIAGRKIWDYPEHYLIALCDKCHLSEHAALELIRLKGIEPEPFLKMGMLALEIYEKIKNKEELIPF